MRRILLIGENGQVGFELQRALAPLGSVACASRGNAALPVDLTNPDAIRTAVRAVNPSVIVNAAAYTAVDRAEQEPDHAMAVNGLAPGVLAEEALRLGAVLAHYSTDYVFAGAKSTPYNESDATGPVNVYGQTKLAGEQAMQAIGGDYFIFRLSWVYGLRGGNFLLTMLRLFRDKDELRVADDQLGSPSWSRDIAAATAQVLAQVVACPGADDDRRRSLAGVYHMTAAGRTSWCGFARCIQELSHRNGLLENTNCRLVPIKTEDYPTPARRPAYSILSNKRLGEAFGLTLPHWEQSLRLCLSPAQIDSSARFGGNIHSEWNQ